MSLCVSVGVQNRPRAFEKVEAQRGGNVSNVGRKDRDSFFYPSLQVIQEQACILVPAVVYALWPDSQC